MNEAKLVEEIKAPKAVVDEFRHGLRAQAALAAVRQEKLNALAAVEEQALMDGIGQRVMRVDADVYWLMRQKFGPDCWRDRGFRKSVVKGGLVKQLRGRSGRPMIRL